MFDKKLLFVAAMGVAFASSAWAAEGKVALLPDENAGATTLTADVDEQAHIVVPSGVTFHVVDIASNTAADAATITVDNIVLATATKQLKVSLKADAASFTPSVASAVTWDASDVSWNAASWTGATGATGTLSNSEFGAVATCTADVATCYTSALVFTLADKTTVKRSGNHTLALTWKVESIGS
jgi:hypothetical protein